jgi:SAM-dependent methyltransferase
MPQEFTKSIRAAQYFDAKAGAYLSQSGRGLWKTVRDREAGLVLRAVGDPQGHSFLDLGSGAGYYASYFAELGAAYVHAVDLSVAMIGALPDCVEGTVGDITTCRLGKTFSRIICAGALEFVDDLEATFKNAFDHGDPGALFVVLVPHATLIGRIYGYYHHRHGLDVRLFTAETLIDAGAKTGWAVDSIQSTLPFALVTAFRKPLQ